VLGQKKLAAHLQANLLHAPPMKKSRFSGTKPSGPTVSSAIQQADFVLMIMLVAQLT